MADGISPAEAILGRADLYYANSHIIPSTMPSERVQRRIERLLDQAEEAVDERDWPVVDEIARSVLNIAPSNSDAQAFLGLAAPHVGGQSTPVTQVQNAPPPARVTELADGPTSFANGRYEVKSLLGEGGKKKVYLAHDTTLDRDVAFGLIKAEGLDAASRQRITREAQAMARLGDNPNIMPIFDLGEENGQPFMVQPLMGGGDVEQLIDEADAGRLSLERGLQIATEICRGLEFAHAKGIIHRDLKPGNVWLTDDGTARIGDFGLAISLDRSRLTQEKMMVGTVSYMPPEQATGGEITAQADLYSLGAMLYEMVTGRTPFMGDDDIAIIGQHINTPPVAPQWHRPEIPATLDSLIMRLMSKNPSERPESASDVLSALSAINVSESSFPEALEGPGASGAGASSTRGSLDSMASGVFVGRHAETDQLKAKLENALSGRGGMVALVGEPGIGKTRTSLELETYAGLRNAQVLWGKCYEGGGAPPYWPWVQAIRSFVASHEPEQVRSQMGSTASVIAEIVDDVKTSLPDVHAPPQLDDLESARFRLFDSIATFLKNAGNVKPIVLILDDLHWADKPSLMLLEFVVRELASSRVLLVGTYRDMELNRRHPLSMTLGDLTRERMFERVLLRGLTHNDVARFIELAAGIVPPRGLVDAVHAQTEGNPLFVTETVRLLVQEGDLTPDRTSGRDSWTVRIPEGVREVIGRRLDRLSERCNAALTVASVIGRQFTLDQLRAVVDDTSEDQLLDLVDEGLLARVIEELPAEVGLYQFSHALVEETLREELSLTRRVRLHGRIAQALESMYGDEADSHAELLCDHFEQAQAQLGVERLVHYAEVAGNRALGLYAYEDAALFYGQGLNALEDQSTSEIKARITEGLARAQIVILGRDRMQDAIDNIRSAFDAYVELDMPDRAVSIASVPMPSIHGPTGMAELLERAIQMVEPGTIEHARLAIEYGQWVSHERGESEAGLSSVGMGLTTAREVGDKRLELRALIKTGTINSWDMALHKIQMLLPRVEELLVEVDDPESMVDIYFGMTFRSFLSGDLDSGKVHAAKVTAAAERSRSVFHWTSAMTANSVLAQVVGDWQTAREHINSGLERSPTEGRLLTSLLRIETALGNYDAADDLFRKLSVSDGGGFGRRFGLLMTLGGGLHATRSGSIDVEGVREDAKRTYQNRTIEARTVMGAQKALVQIALEDKDVELAVDLFSNPRVPWENDTAVEGIELVGQLAALAGDFDASQRYFDQVIERMRAAGYRPVIAEVAVAYSEMLVERDGPGDAEGVPELQDEAIAIATELGMKPLLERVLAQREILKA
ncbi:MAG: protein kinase [Chloroflexi bacterium]|nr:protein kinase [Chloroflexota bacterium]